MDWFYNYLQLKYIFYLKNLKYKWTGIWMFVFYIIKIKNDKELWFIVNGVFIRYFFREMIFISGLYCYVYFNNYDRMGGLSFIEKYFELWKKIKYEIVEKKLKVMKGRFFGERLKKDVLYFLYIVILGFKKIG